MAAATRHRSLAPVGPGLLLLAVWWLAAEGGSLPGYVLPGPQTVALRLVEMLRGTEIWRYVGMTALEAVGGALLGVAVALPLAIITHRSAWTAAAVTPFLGATQAIPAIALAPLLVLWIGYGLPAIVVLCSLMVFFPILIGTVLGLRQVDRDVIDAARIDGASSWELLRHVEAPMALPSVLAGLRNGFTLAVTGAVVGEMVMGGTGMGTILTVQRDAVDTAGMFASIFLLCVLASTAYTLISLWERRSRVIQSLV